MGVNVTVSSRRQQWHIDHVNNAAGDPAEVLSRALRFMQAELKACAKVRPEDADGFRRQLAYLIADFLRQVPGSRPVAEFQTSFPALAGGGWTPVPHKGVAPAVEHP